MTVGITQNMKVSCLLVRRALAAELSLYQLKGQNAKPFSNVADSSA